MRVSGRLAAVGAGLWVSGAVAGTIGITTSVETQVTNNTVRVVVIVKNTGDELCYNVQAQIRAFASEVTTVRRSEFPPNVPIRFAETLPLGSAPPGVYAVIVRVFCTDANQYPFSALAPHLFAVGERTKPIQVAGTMDNISISDGGKLNVRLKNMGDSDYDATIKLITPRELTAENPEARIVIPARSDKNVRFDIENFSARAPSTYPIVATVEYDDDGTHQTTLAPGVVTIVEQKRIFGFNYSVLAGVLVLLVVAFIVLEKLKKK
jgi:hypothetical protein